MKGLFTGVVLLAVLGIIGFLYRYTLEHPAPHLSGSNACTQEAKLCPDGSSVGRTGPGCTFAACALPNKEMSDLGIAFVIPTGYAENTNAPQGDSLVAAFDKPVDGQTAPDTIVIRKFVIPEGKNANDVMLGQTQYESSGAQPKSMSEFTPVIISGHTYQSVTVERFEAIVHTFYYLPREKDVLRFEVLERGITNWNDPKLVTGSLPEHAALLRMLGTLQVK